MKILISALSLFGIASAVTLSTPAHAAVTEQVSSADTPTIISVRGRIVKVQVPAGYEKVTLQRRTPRKNLPWAPMATQASDGTAKELTFRIATPFPKHLMRVVGVAEQKEPVISEPGSDGTEEGLTEFLGDPNYQSEQRAGGITLGDGATNFTGSNGLALALNSSAASSDAAANLTVNETVMESDIWKSNGDRLYVFNPYRGLQTIDISKPKSPALLGTLYFPGAGEDLYLLGRNHVVMLANSSANFQWNKEFINRNGAAVIVCDVSKANPEIVKRLPIEGSVLESRMVGSLLYVATEVNAPSGNYDERSIQVTGFDLRDPQRPVKRNTVTIPGAQNDYWSYFGALQASDDFFMVTRNVYKHDPATWTSDYVSEVNLVEITARDGSVVLRGMAPVGGFVQDKFKMQENDGVLTVIADHLQFGTAGVRRHTHLENFSLANPNNPKSIGEIDLGFNESVRATRFDGKRVYVVTFEQIDPLWIVDNSKPAAPKIAGHLELPGFSTYIEPLGDRLVTMGFLNNQPAVTLFDVANPAVPKVLSQINVASPSGWSYSEANSNEKAFTVVPDAGLIMVPLVEWAWSYNDTTRASVQLIDFNRSTLKLRGSIRAKLEPRRTKLYRDTALVLSSGSLASVDIANRDNPKIVSDVDLAWRADFVWRVGSRLLQVGGSVGGDQNTISVSPQDVPDDVLSSLNIGMERIIAADHRDGLLYIVQQSPEVTEVPQTTDKVASALIYSMKLSIFNTESLPALVKVSEKVLKGLPAPGWDVKMLWPAPGTMVLATQQGNYLFGSIGIPIHIIRSPGFVTFGTTQQADSGSVVAITNTSASTSIAFNNTATSSLIAGDGGVYLYNPYSVMHLIAVDVSNEKTPQLIGTNSLTPKANASYGQAFVADGKIYVTHQVSWYRYPYYYPYNLVLVTEDSESAQAEKEEAKKFEAVRGRYFLNVVDYATPTAPVVSEPMSAPGTLKGLSPDGRTLFTMGPDYDDQGYPKYTTQNLHATRYKGTHMRLLAKHPVSPNGAEIVTTGERVFLFESKPDSANENRLTQFASLLELDANSKFKQLDEIRSVGYSPHVFGDVVFTHSYTGYGYALAALDFSTPTDLRTIGSYNAGWINLNLPRMQGNRQDGYWFPTGQYGVLKVELPTE